MLFIINFLSKSKKKFILCFMLLWLPPLDKLREYCGLFFDADRLLPTLDNSPQDQEFKAKIEYATTYLQQLADRLLYEKYNSDLVKELLLYNHDFSDLWCDLWTAFDGLQHERQPKNIIYNGIYGLNLYRLGFIDAFIIRSTFRTYRKQLNIKNNQEYVNALKKAIDLYCSLYPWDESDKKAFEQLVNYKFCDRAASMLPWGDEKPIYKLP